jgi:hypothetical protein
MNWQFLIVLAIVSLAVFFIGKNLLLKAKSFSPKNSCASDCGCDSTQKAK